MENLILTYQEVQQKIKRIAHEIYEKNYHEEEIVFAGIYERGYQLAQLLEKEVDNIAKNINTSLVKISLDKYAPLQSEIELDVDIKTLENKIIILVDDVLNTGRTLAYSLKPFLNCEIKQLHTAILVDRNHPQFPISADFVGYSLSTTIQEHILVDLSEDKGGVYLK
ncbi:MAG: phosphoribosyltransferase [Cytophagales bacterium]|nr:phosphoribosyltransferase [Cytophagales bacterium]